MQPILSSFPAFLSKYGIITDIEKSYLSSSKTANKNASQFIYFWKEIIKTKASNHTNNVLHFSQNLLNQYILYDNQKVIDKLRRWLLYHRKTSRVLLWSYLMKWKVTIVKINIIRTKVQEIQTSKKEWTRIVKSNSMTNVNCNKEKMEKYKALLVEQNAFSIQSKNKPRKKIIKEGTTTFIEKNKNNFKSEGKELPLQKQRNHSAKNIMPSDTCYSRRYYTNSNNAKMPLKQVRRSKLTKQAKKEYLQEWSNTAVKRNEKIWTMKAIWEEDFNNKYTFHPVFYTQQNRRNQSQRSKSPVLFLERQSEFIVTRNNKINELKKYYENERPRAKTWAKPTHEIWKNIPNWKEYKLKQATKRRNWLNKVKIEQDITFKPNWNDTSKIGSTIHERTNEHINKIEQLHWLNPFDAVIEKECTFCPVVNNTNTIKEDTTTVGIRLNNYAVKYNCHKEELRKANQKEYSFSPVINKYNINNNNRSVEMRDFSQDENNNYSVGRQELKKNKENFNGDNNWIYSANKEIIEIPDEDANSMINYESKDLKNSALSKYLAESGMKTSIGSWTDEKIMEMAKMKISVDESLEKYKEKFKKIIDKHKNGSTIKSSIESKDRNNL